MNPITNFSDLCGVTLVKIDRTEDRLTFTANDGRRWLMLHNQDCCENVAIEDIAGDLNDIIGTPIMLAEERCSSDPQVGQDTQYSDSFTWTFYELRTIKGSVTVRWYGESNGYYSESVDFEVAEPHTPEDDATWLVAGDLALSRGEHDSAARYRAYFQLGGK